MRNEEEPRVPEKGATPVPDIPSAPAAGPSVSGAASGSRPPRTDLPPACVYCKTAAVGRRDVRQGRRWTLGLERPGQLWACVRRGWGRQGDMGLLHRRGPRQGAAPHPLPGLLQVVPQDFADLLFFVLGECWQDAVCRQGLGMDVSGTTWHRLVPQENSCDPGACWTGPEGGHLGDSPGGGAKQCSPAALLPAVTPSPGSPAPGWCRGVSVGAEAARLVISTHCMETVETAEGILPMPPLSTSSIACFISILW